MLRCGKGRKRFLVTCCDTFAQERSSLFVMMPSRLSSRMEVSFSSLRRSLAAHVGSFFLRRNKNQKLD